MTTLAMVVAGCSSDDNGDSAAPPTGPSSTDLPRRATPTVSTVVATTTEPPTAPTTTSSPPTSGAAATPPAEAADAVRPGDRVLVDEGFAPIAGARVGLIVNQTSVVDGRHLIDLVAEADAVELVAIFAPEHGVRGTADAGEAVDDDTDTATGVPIHSLYGDTKAPTAAMLADLDVLVYDLQDLGARYYTYASTMGLAMQAAADTDTRFVVLDRPVPAGGDVVTGPVRAADQESFVGRYPIPSQYGLTAGELARAIVGEGWLSGLEGLDLEVVEVEGWGRSRPWPDTGLAWIPPSPGLPELANALSYPATVVVEATNLSYGRGTFDAFTLVGAPWVDPATVTERLNARSLTGVRFEPVEFVPRDLEIAIDPPYEGEVVRGVKVVVTDPATFDGSATGVHLLEVFADEARTRGRPPIVDRPEMLDLLTGTSSVRQQLDARMPADEIVAGWRSDLLAFAEVRRRYLIYSEG